MNTSAFKLMCVCVYRLAGACEASYPGYTVVLSSVFFHAHILDILPAVLALYEVHWLLGCFYLFNIQWALTLDDLIMCMFPQ